MLEKSGDYSVTRNHLEQYILSGTNQTPTMAYLIGLDNLEKTNE
ncbi:hypothetical protein [Mammaliicoccus lentus]|jgi:hypothetical protein